MKLFLISCMMLISASVFAQYNSEFLHGYPDDEIAFGSIISWANGKYSTEENRVVMIDSVTNKIHLKGHFPVSYNWLMETKNGGDLKSDKPEKGSHILSKTWHSYQDQAKEYIKELDSELRLVSNAQ